MCTFSFFQSTKRFSLVSKTWINSWIKSVRSNCQFQMLARAREQTHLCLWKVSQRLLVIHTLGVGLVPHIASWDRSIFLRGEKSSSKPSILEKVKSFIYILKMSESVMRINRWNGYILSPLSVKIYWKRQIHKQNIIELYTKRYKHTRIQWCGTQRREGFVCVCLCMCCCFSPLPASLSRSLMSRQPNKEVLNTHLELSCGDEGFTVLGLNKVLIM